MKILPDKVYNVLKWLALIAINALGICYAGLADVWGLPFGDKINDTCQLISVLIGTLIGISTAGYYMEQKKNNTSVTKQKEKK